MFTYAVASDPAAAGYAMVSDRFLAVLAAGAGDDTALRLWQALSGDGPSLGSVLSALAAEGIATLPDFALVELVDAGSRSVALAVRGHAGIVLAGSGEERSGRGAGSWRESSADRVEGLSLRLAAAAPAGAGRLPLGRGVVRADRLDWGDPALTRATAVPASEPAPDPIDPPLETIRRRRSPEPPVSVDAVATAPADSVDPIDDRTELSRVHRRSSARPVLRVGDDRVLELDLPVVFGRSPRPAAHPGARLVALPSPRREISGAHLEVRLDGDVLVARDLDSTNGTIVREPDGSMQLLRHGSSARLVPGASLDLGDGAVAVFDVADRTGG